MKRALATSILVGTSIVGSGVGFAIPTLVVGEESEGEVGRREVFSLYFGYAVATFIMLIANTVLMRSKPALPASNIESKQQLGLKETFGKIRRERNLWTFFMAYSLFYGTFFIFASVSNFLIKPFGLSDVMISLSAVGLIVVGAVGAILSSVYIKRTRNYRKLIKILTLATSLLMTVFTLQCFILPSPPLTVFLVAFLGLFVVPIVPITY